MPVRPTLLHRMALVSFLLFRKNLGNLREFFGQIVYRPPWPKIARTPMSGTPLLRSPMGHKNLAILTGGHINKIFFYDKMYGHVITRHPNKVAVITR